jgi:hypothetical protein
MAHELHMSTAIHRLQMVSVVSGSGPLKAYGLKPPVVAAENLCGTYSSKAIRDGTLTPMLQHWSCSEAAMLQ